MGAPVSTFDGAWVGEEVGTVPNVGATVGVVTGAEGMLVGEAFGGPRGTIVVGEAVGSEGAGDDEETGDGDPDPDGTVVSIIMEGALVVLPISAEGASVAGETGLGAEVKEVGDEVTSEPVGLLVSFPTLAGEGAGVVMSPGVGLSVSFVPPLGVGAGVVMIAGVGAAVPLVSGEGVGETASGEGAVVVSFPGEAVGIAGVSVGSAVAGVGASVNCARHTVWSANSSHVVSQSTFPSKQSDPAFSFIRRGGVGQASGTCSDKYKALSMKFSTTEYVESSLTYTAPWVLPLFKQD